MMSYYSTWLLLWSIFCVFVLDFCLCTESGLVDSLWLIGYNLVLDILVLLSRFFLFSFFFPLIVIGVFLSLLYFTYIADIW